MKVSMTYDLRNPPQWRRPFPEFYRESLDHMAYMEELGFDAIWLQQHHFEESAYGPSFAALAGFLAARTKRVRVGSFIKILPLYHPLLVAEEMAFLDNILDGRLDVGVGIGHRLLEFNVLGVSPKQRPSRMEEGLDIMKLAWTEERFSYQGRRFQLDDVEVWPKPIQKPHPPLFMAVRSQKSAERAARYRCHLAPAATDPEVYHAYTSTLRRMGEDPADYHVTIGLSVIITQEDPEKVWERLLPYADYSMRFYDNVAREIGDPPMRSGLPGSGPIGPGEYRSRFVIGTADDVLEALEGMRPSWSWDGLKLDEVALRTPPPGLPLTDYMSTYETFAAEIMPVLRTW